MRVLVADDDTSSLITLQAYLESLGYEVSTATNGREAFEMIQANDFRLVISDWEMPELNGLDLCRRVRERQLASYVYFIMLTGRQNEDDLIEGLDAGADDFVRKPFKPDELRVRLRAADRIAALEGRDIFIFSLAKLAESRDTDTGAHLERMREYSRVLAEYMSTTEKYSDIVDADYIRTVYATSPLHDIGKVGIPDDILLKPGRLTPEEFEIMKMHTVIGYETLESAVLNNPSAKFYRFAQDIVLNHHERWDGKGYPNGVSGEQIPLCGRIVSVADVYDALTTKRVYKNAFTHEKAREIILEGRGSAFDPDVVDAFLAMEDEFVRIKDRLNEERQNSSNATGFASIQSPTPVLSS